MKTTVQIRVHICLIKYLTQIKQINEKSYLIQCHSQGVILGNSQASLSSYTLKRNKNNFFLDQCNVINSWLSEAAHGKNLRGKGL